MAHFDSVEQLFDNLDDIAALNFRGSKSLADKIAPHREQVLMAKQLTTLKADISLICSVEELRCGEVDEKLLREFLQQLGIALGAVQGLFAR